MIIAKKKIDKKKVIIFASIILLFLITIAIITTRKTKESQQSLEQEIERVRQYSNINEFKNIEEVALYLDCKFIKQEDSNQEGINYNIYMELPIKIEDGQTTNQNFVQNLIQYSSYALGYKNFIIIDESSGTNIVVYCNEEQQLVQKYYINEVENYFEVQKNKQNIENFETVNSIEVQVTSAELQQIISNNWQANKLSIGTAESFYRDYDIYFDEGFQIRKVNGKVFNIVFTDKYSSSVINNLTTKSTTEEIEKTLGKSQFESGSLKGYKCKNLYVFFYEGQISIYRIEEYETDKIAEAAEKFISEKISKEEFVSEVKNIWKDYDIYEYASNSVKLQYTLKGMCIKFDSTTEKGIIIYNNYSGKIYGNTTLQQIINTKENLPSSVFINNSDLVFEAEKTRVNTLDNTSSQNNYISSVIPNISSKFKIYKSALNSDKTLYNVRFISINNEFPNSELREAISEAIWYDDYNFVYSVKSRGIYVYNVRTRTYSSLVTGKENYDIYTIENGVLYYDQTSIEINL